MHRARSLLFLLLSLVAVAGVATAMFALRASPAGADKSPAAEGEVERVTTVAVTATEFKFRLSKKSIPAVGTVVFRILNRGKIAHNFKIAGKRTSILKPGQSALVRVVFRKRGSYPYLCTLPGHAAAGMKGVFGVGATMPPPTTTSTTTTTTTGVSTTVTVDEFEFAFTLSQSTVPAGTVTFVMKNTGTIAHNFDLQGVAGGTGPILDGGQSATMTVTLTRPGTYTYVCDVPGHAQAGMAGKLVVE